MRVEVDHLPILDIHAHPFLDRGPLTGETLSALTSFGGAGVEFLELGGVEADATMRAEVLRAQQGTVYHRRMIRDLARFLGCDPSADAVAEARNARVGRDGFAGYIRDLYAAARLETIVFDMGYPLPMLPLEEVRAQVPVEIVPIYRIEPLIADLLKEEIGWAEFRRRYDDAIVHAITDEGYRGLKSVIAYRTGLDIAPVSRTPDQGFQALDAIRRGLGGGSMKRLRDHLFCRAMELAIEFDVPFQVHTGMGDFEVNLPLSSPAYLMDLLRFPVYRSCRVLLVHGGYPHLKEAGYIAGILPRVYLDLSEGIPFAAGGAKQIVADALDMVPLHKICYGSDGFFVPEICFASAMIGKRAVAAALEELIADDLLTPVEAQDAAGRILAGNGREFYRLDPVSLA